MFEGIRIVQQNPTTAASLATWSVTRSEILLCSPFLSGPEDYVYLGMNTDNISVSEMSIQKFPEAGKLIPFVQAILDLMYLKNESEDQSLKDKHLSSPPPPATYLLLSFSCSSYSSSTYRLPVNLLCMCFTVVHKF